MAVTFPLAEHVARKMKLPVTVCPVSKELYGVSVPVLDEKAAGMALSMKDIYGEAREVALAILNERVERLARA